MTIISSKFGNRLQVQNNEGTVYKHVSGTSMERLHGNPHWFLSAEKANGNDSITVVSSYKYANRTKLLLGKDVAHKKYGKGYVSLVNNDGSVVVVFARGKKKTFTTNLLGLGALQIYEKKDFQGSCAPKESSVNDDSRMCPPRVKDLLLLCSKLDKLLLDETRNLINKQLKNQVIDACGMTFDSDVFMGVAINVYLNRLFSIKTRGLKYRKGFVSQDVRKESFYEYLKARKTLIDLAANNGAVSLDDKLLDRISKVILDEVERFKQDDTCY